jgi:arylsulfatase A-like enzyme
MDAMSRRRLRLAALAAIVGLSGCGESGGRWNVLFIVVDTLRADQLACYGNPRPTSPAADALAGGGVQFARAYSVAPWTIPSVATMFTGMYPSKHGVRSFGSRIPEEAPVLAAILREAGYATAAVVSHSLVGSSRGFDRGFEVFHEDEALGHDHVSTAGVTRRARELLETFAVDGRPFFLFVHYFDPHYDFRPHPEYGFESPGPGRLDGTEDIWKLREMLPGLTAAEIGHLVNLYHEEIRFTDSGIASLRKSLDELGFRESTLVVLTSDHGEEFRDRDWLGHTTTLYEELTHVPLVIDRPSAPDRGRVVSEPVSLVSISPTILDLLGLDSSNRGYQSASFAALLDPGGEAPPPSPIFAEVDVQARRKRTHKKAITEGRYKLIRDDRTRRLELYDLAADAGERVDLARDRPELVREMEARLEGVLELVARDPLPAAEKAIEGELEALHSLGYVESRSGAERDSSASP